MPRPGPDNRGCSEGTRGNSANEYPPKLAMDPNRLSVPAMPRTRPLLLWIAALSLLLGVAGGSYAKAVQTDHVEAELIAERTATEPGRPLRIGLRLKMDEHWHAYWRNPGDTGLPTTIKWQLPAGFQAGDIDWPAPQRIDVGPFANYGYEGEVVLPVSLAAPADLAPGTSVPIRARADWLVCREQCIPGGADLELDLKSAAGGGPDQRWAGLFAKAQSDLPRAAGDWQWSAYRTGSRLDLVWMPPAASVAPSRVQFFPHAENVIEPAARQALYRLPDGRLRMSLVVSKQLAQMPASIDGVLTTASGWGKDTVGGARAISMSAKVEGALPSSTRQHGARLRGDVCRRRLARHDGSLRRDRAGACRWLDPQPDALRISGNFAQGARFRAAGAWQVADHPDPWPGLRGRRRALVCRAGRSRPRAARKRRGTRMGVSVAVAGGGHRAGDPVLLAHAQHRRLFRSECAGAQRRRRVRGAESVRQFLSVRGARGRHCVALHGAIHGCGAGLRAGAATGGGAGHLRGAGPGDGVAVSAARVVPRRG